MSDVAANLTDRELAELCALADGTLPAEQRPAVEARVAASPELQELVDRQREALAATRALEDEPVPESLRTTVTARWRASDRRRGRASWFVPRLALAGAAAVAVALVAVLLIGGPGGPTVAEAARLAERPPSGPAPGPAGESGTKLALAVDGVVFPDLRRPFGWRAVGMRRDRLDDRGAAVVYYANDGRRIAYVIVAGAGLPRPEAAKEATRAGVLFQLLEIGGRSAVTWRRAGHTCVLIGAATHRELLALANWRGEGTLRY
jgi:anti-sigma factor RsiW